MPKNFIFSCDSQDIQNIPVLELVNTDSLNKILRMNFLLLRITLQVIRTQITSKSRKDHQGLKIIIGSKEKLS